MLSNEKALVTAKPTTASLGGSRFCSFELPKVLIVFARESTLFLLYQSLRSQSLSLDVDLFWVVGMAVESRVSESLIRIVFCVVSVEVIF